MCTAATYKTKDFISDVLLDYEFSYGDEDHHYTTKLSFRFPPHKNTGKSLCTDWHGVLCRQLSALLRCHQRKGLGMAGLNFVGNAHYQPLSDSEENIASFEFIPWIFRTVCHRKEVRSFLGRMNLCDTPFSDQFPSSSLHWLIADRSESITVECVADGMKIYDNPVGVLTNNPPV